MRARARRSARRPSATRSPRWARSSASRSSRSARSAAPSAYPSAPSRSQIATRTARNGSSASPALRHRADHRRRHPPRRAELAQLGSIEIAREPAGTLERVLDRLGPDVRIAVEVAADPGAEPQRLAGAREPLAECPLEIGDRVPEALLEEPEALPDLVHDAGSLRADLVRLPEQRDLLRQLSSTPLPLGGAACRRRRGGRGARRRADALRARCGAWPRSDGP